MGRRKILIKKLESATQRKITYHNRYKGICKKVRELSIMSDVSVLVVAKNAATPGVLFNACFEGDRSSRDFILQYLNESNEIKAKSMHSTGEENNAKYLENLKRQVAEIEDRLHRLRSLQKINQLQNIESLEELHEMENSIRDFINSTSGEDKKVTQEPPLHVYHEPIVPDPSHPQWQMPINPRYWEAAEYQAAVYPAAQLPPPRAHGHEAPLPVYHEPNVPDPSHPQWQMPINPRYWEAAEYQAAVYPAAQLPPPRAHDHEGPLLVYHEPNVPDPSHPQWQMTINPRYWEAAVYPAAQWPPPRAHDHEAGSSHQQEFWDADALA